MSELEATAKQIMDNFLKTLGDNAKSLTAKDKELVSLAAKDAANLAVKALTGKNFDAEIRIVKATLLNITCAKTIAIERAFWLSVESAAKTAISAGIRIAIASIAV